MSRGDRLVMLIAKMGDNLSSLVIVEFGDKGSLRLWGMRIFPPKNNKSINQVKAEKVSSYSVRWFSTCICKECK